MNINTNNVFLQITAGLKKQFPSQQMPHIIFSGKSNVGKSSLINTLLNRKSLARVSSSPGKTITVNFYNIDNKLFFVDLPGYGYAKRSFEDKQKWSKLTENYLMSNNSAGKLFLQLIDMKSGPSDDDIMMLEWLNKSDIPYIIVGTKSDKLNKTETAEALNELNKLGEDVVAFSSLKKTGVKELWNAIFDYLQ